MGRLVVWLMPVGRRGFCSVCSWSCHFCLIRQLFGEQQEGEWWLHISSFPIRGRKRASQTDKLGEHDSVPVCKGDLCSFVDRRVND